jgi:hypothetical protein
MFLNFAGDIILRVPNRARASVRTVLKDDPDVSFEGGCVQLRLTYEGILLGASRSNTRASHKHDLRKVFHQQLREFWRIDPFLSTAQDPDAPAYWEGANPIDGEYGNDLPDYPLLRDSFAKQYERGPYKFVPLVTRLYSLHCSIDILFLRPSTPGQILSSGDIDNRLKTIFDALRLPSGAAEWAGAEPTDGEDPFYVLLEDDSLITRVSVETDTLLEPVSKTANLNDARLVITVSLKPYHVSLRNLNFA